MTKRREPIRSSRALMAQRHEDLNSLDNFMTPPFATRALCEVVFPHLGVDPSELSVWEPACGEGVMAAVLKEYFKKVHATDIYDYGGNQLCDFLSDDADRFEFPWIITNPPFKGMYGGKKIDRGLEFTLRALQRASKGVAMFVRTQLAAEGVERYERLIAEQPPTVFASFVERVPLRRGAWNPDGSTATQYCWLVWVKGKKPRPMFWIPPGQRKALTRVDGRARFAPWSLSNGRSRETAQRSRAQRPHSRAGHTLSE